MNVMKARQTRGFTLLETLVVLVITSLVSVVLVQGFGLILAARTSVQTKLVDLDRLVLERNLFLEPLRGILPDYPERPHVFVGEARQLHGLTARALEERLGAVVPFTLSMEFDAGKDRTSLIYQEESAEPRTLGSWEGDVGAFSYRDRVGDWQDSWHPDPAVTSQTPWLIKLDLGTGFPSSLIASVAGPHQRRPRLQDVFGSGSRQ